MRRIARAVGLGIVLALLLGSTISVGTAAAGHLGCGDVVTHNVTLDGDIGPCAGTGLIVGTDGITVDLGGHRVFATTNPGEGAGILLEGRARVRVTNGVVEHFDAGVAIVGGSGNQVIELQAIRNIGAGTTDFGDGIAISASADNLVRNNVVRGNGPFSGIGVFGAESMRNVIDRNVVEDNNVQSNARVNQDDGIRLEPFTSENVVTNNRVHGSGLDGIALFRGSSDNRVQRNDVRRNGFHGKMHRQGDGIAVFNQADRNLIQRNQVFDNAANGIFLRGPSFVAGARNNEILFNGTGNNGPRPGPGGFRYDLRDGNPDCDDNRWFGNTYLTALPACTTDGPNGRAAPPARTGVVPPAPGWDEFGGSTSDRPSSP